MARQFGGHLHEVVRVGPLRPDQGGLAEFGDHERWSLGSRQFVENAVENIQSLARRFGSEMGRTMGLRALSNIPEARDRATAERAIERAQSLQRDRESGQFNLFGELEEASDASSEPVDLIDADDRIIGWARRGQIPALNLLHRGVGIICYNSRSEIYLHNLPRAGAGPI